MAFLAKRARAALTAFMQPNAVKSSFGVNGIYDALYGGAALVGRNRDIPLSEQGAATAFGLNTGLQRGIRFKQDALGMLKWGIYDSHTNELLLSLSDRTLDMSKPGAVLLTAFRNYALRHYHDFLGSLIFSNNLYGESFVLRLSNPMGGVTGLRWLNPLYTEPNIQQGKIKDFRYSAGEGSFTLPVSSMAFNIYHVNPNDDLRGLPPVLSALDSVNIERNEKRAVQAYFRNGMNPGGAMSPKGENAHLHELEINQMQARFQQLYNGVDNMFRWLITPTEFAYQAFEQPDLQKNWTIIQSARAEVTMALGVPVELAGDPSVTKYENADKVMQNWLRVNGRAEANGIGNFVTDHLLSYTDPDADIYFGYDASDIDRQDAPLTQSDFTSGIITINQAQAERGYDVDPALDGIYILPGGKPVHRDVLIQVSKDVSAFTGQPPAPALPLYSPDTMTIPGTVNQPPALPEPEPQKGAASLCVMLTFANNPDLIDLQKRLKSMFTAPGIKWNDPADFHATLLYAPSVTDEQVDTLTESLDLNPEGIWLKVGSLACFDNVGEHALHFRIARNSDLLDMQSGLYDLCKEAGLQMSGYSNPDNYTPHITMGYLPENSGRIVFHGKVKVTPDDVVCSVERGGEYEIVWNWHQLTEGKPEPAKSTGASIVSYVWDIPEGATTITGDNGAVSTVTLAHDDHAHTLPVVTREYSPAKALAELKAWRTFVSKKHARPFEFVMLRGDPADDIARLTSEGASPDYVFNTLKYRFDGSRLKTFEATITPMAELVFNNAGFALETIELAVKSIGDLESDFASRFNNMIRDFRAGSPRNPDKARSILSFLNQNFVRGAYIEGLIAGGVEDDPSDDDNVRIRELVSAANSHVSSFIGTLYDDGVSDAQAALKAGQWWRGSIMPAYSAGLLSANGNLMMEFGGEDGDEICPTCQRLKGQRHRFKDWVKRNLDVPKVGQATECKGWQCAHKLIPVTGKAAGNW